jgi:hypothetical protein
VKMKNVTSPLWIGALLTLMVSACTVSRPTSAPEPGSGTGIDGAVLTVAAEKGFHYRQTVNDALSGNQDALHKLLSFSHETDGEAGLDHGNVLLDVREKIGASRFDAILKSMPLTTQKEVEGLLRTATGMRKFSRAVLQQGQNSQ